MANVVRDSDNDYILYHSENLLEFDAVQTFTSIHLVLAMFRCTPSTDYRLP